MMEQRRVASWWAQWTCVGGTCALPAAPPRTGFERLLDAYTRALAGHRPMPLFGYGFEATWRSARGTNALRL